MTILTPFHKKWISELYRNNALKMASYAAKHLPNAELAAELVDEVFLIAIYKIHSLIQSPQPVGWLMNTLKLVIKHELRNPRYRQEGAPPDDNQFVLDNFADHISVADQLPIGLNAAEKQLLIWAYEDGLSCEQIAQMLGVSLECCYKRLSRARIRCRELWDNGEVL